MKQNELADMMQAYNGVVTNGSVCHAWQDFAEDCYQRLGTAPWGALFYDPDVPVDMAEYWVAVSLCKNPDYDEEGMRNV